MSIVSHMGIDYDYPTLQIQNNSSATDLDNNKVPTGQTIKSYLYRKNDYIQFVWETVYAADEWTKIASKIIQTTATYTVIATVYFKQAVSSGTLNGNQAMKVMIGSSDVCRANFNMQQNQPNSLIATWTGTINAGTECGIYGSCDVDVNVDAYVAFLRAN